MSLHYLGKHEPRKCLFSDSGKLGIRRDHPYRRIEMKFCVVGGLHEIVLWFEFHRNRYRVIANGHEKLNKLIIAQAPWLLRAKIIKIARSASKL